MSAQNVEIPVENRNFLATQNDVGPAQSAAAAMTAAMVASGALDAAAERTSGESRSAPTTMSVDDDEECDESAAGGKQLLVPVVAGNSSERSSGGGGANEKRRSSDGGKRKTRRGKAKRGKRRSSSSRPFPKSQWNFLAPNVRSAANKRRSERLAAGVALVPLKDAFRKSDQPPLVPYNTNRFLMEDHMPHVLTPSEDEEEFLTKEFSSVYEDARSERLEELSKSQLIQEYLQLEANYEQVMRRYNAAKSAKEENESGAAVQGSATSPSSAVTTKDAAPTGTDRRRLEDRVRELTTENLELRRQLEHAARIGMVLSAKSSPRPHNPASAAMIGNTLGDRMDSSSCSSSEDSESDSSSSTSSSSSDDDNNGDDASSSSSMSDIDGNHAGTNDDPERVPEDRLPLMNGAEDGADPLEHQNGYQLNGGEDDIPLRNGNGDHQNEASLSPRGIHSPPPPPLAMN